MKKLKLLGFLFAAISLLVLGSNSPEAYAAESNIIEAEFDLSKNEPQEVTYVNEDGEEVTISIEPVEDGPISLNSHTFPYGTTRYAVRATSGYTTMGFDVNVYVPSDINQSRFIWVGEKYFHSVTGYLTNDAFTPDPTQLTNGNYKEVKYSGQYVILGIGSATAWTKATLDKNVLTISASL
ncbi:MAG TPA: DUF5626 family protein [Bacillales bacterium]|nr:DUF5626 family protein [Bacillales bacterium]